MSTHTNYALRQNKASTMSQTIKEKASEFYGKMTGGEEVSTLEELFVEQLQDLYSAETQLIEALPKMAEAAQAPDLRAGFETHWRETKGHAVRLEMILKKLGKIPGGKTCKAMEGLIKEGSQTISENATPAVKDAALIAAAQRVEHYEMAGYGTVRTYASLLGDAEAQTMLEQTLGEETATDKKLTAAAQKLNVRIPIR